MAAEDRFYCIYNACIKVKSSIVNLYNTKVEFIIHRNCRDVNFVNYLFKDTSCFFKKGDKKPAKC